MKYYLHFVITLVLIATGLKAQPHKARNLSIEQGLPEYFVSGIAQDRAGFVWIATRDGLARYDGKRFKVFRHQPFRKHSLANSVIFSMKALSDTTLVLHFENESFQLFDPRKEQFTELLTEKQLRDNHLRVSNIVLTRDQKQVWGHNPRQFVNFDCKSKKLKTFTLPQLFIAEEITSKNSTVLDDRQRLLTTSEGRLIEFDTHKNSFVSWKHPAIGKDGKIHNYYGTSILLRRDGNVLISAPQQLLHFDRRTSLFRPIPIPSTIDTKPGVIYEAKDGTVFFTYAMTVYSLSTNNQITAIWTAPKTDYANYFQALLVDHSGVLWIGTNGNGIQQIDLNALPVQTYPYQVNFIHDLLTKELHITAPDWAKTDQYNYLLRFGGNSPLVTIGVGNSYELFRAEANTGRMRSLFKQPVQPSLKEIRGGNGIHVLANGAIWMYNPHMGIIKTDAFGNLLANFTNIPPINLVTAIQLVGKQIWLASELSGLYVYDLDAGRITDRLTYAPSDPGSLPTNRVLSLIVDPRNPAFLWAGTQEGLCLINPKTKKIKIWDQKQGLPSATIQTLLPDSQGNLWFSTLKGISRMDQRTGRIRHFSTADGLLDIEYQQNHATFLPDGRMAFGGAKGITLFNPAAMDDKPQPVPIVLTGLLLSNVPVEANQPNSPLALPLNATGILHLQPDQNFLSLQFAGLIYNKPTSLQYRYQLTGVNSDWVHVGNENAAHYTELDPGTYEFRVNAADAAGNWSPMVKTLWIVIDPPWWRSWWAYLVYGILLIAVIRVYIQYIIGRNKQAQASRLRDQEAALLKQNVDWQNRFFTNITHEFRTPLTLILNPLERLMQHSTLPETSHQYGIMHRNATRLLHLINQLLDVAKLDAKQLRVVESQGDLNVFFTELVDSFQPRAHRRNIELSFAADTLPHALFDTHKLESIGYNLLANAIKFTPEGGTVHTLLKDISTPENRAFEFQVIDTGVGIAHEQLVHIFDRFFQGNHSETGTGTGIGLFLVAELTKLLNGKVAVNSMVGIGTTFTITLPLHLPSNAENASNKYPTLQISHASKDTAYTEKSILENAPLILVVEDHDELREFIAQELSGKYRVLTASEGHQGWQLCLDELPELVISDIMMPGMDGFALVKQIKTTPITAHIGVILLTARTMSDSRIEGLSIGANDYITKPFHAQELHLRIHNLIAHQQQLRNYFQSHNQRFDISGPETTDQEIQDPFLLKFYAIVNSNLHNSKLGVEHLADELAVSPRTLHRKLSALTGTTANELIRTYRLQKAAIFLREGYSVSDAAEKAGFEGLSYFSKSFKAQFDVSPSAYKSAK